MGSQYTAESALYFTGDGHSDRNVVAYGNSNQLTYTLSHSNRHFYPLAYRNGDRHCNPITNVTPSGNCNCNVFAYRNIDSD